MQLSTPHLPAVPAQHFDLLIKGGTVIDGTGAPGFRAEVGVRGGRIAAVGPTPGATASETVDASGRIVCPGFIDIHTHSDLTVLINPGMESSVLQGVTTEVTGNCGLSVGLSIDSSVFHLERRFSGLKPSISWDSLNGFLDLVQENGTAVNFLTLAGHNTIRKRVMGMEMRESTAAEVREMRALLRDALDQGAVGFSTGLEYPPGRSAATAEIVGLAEIAAEAGAFYTSHLRNESDQLVEAVAEALHVGAAAGLPVQLSHHKAEGPQNWGRVAETLAMVDDARAHGQDVTLDQYPYTAYQTGLAIPVFPGWAIGGSEAELQERITGAETRATLLTHLRSLNMDWNAVRISIARVHREYQGRTIAELAAEWDLSPEEALLRVLEDERGFVAAIYVMMSEDDVRRVMRYAHTFIASDAAASANHGPLSQDRPHPRTFGTFPRVLGHYVRELGVLTWESAIAKMTSMPARRIGLPDRGLLREGYAADLVVFNPETVDSGAGEIDPRGVPVGIEAVFVNGCRTVVDGALTGAYPGRVLRRGCML